MYSLELLFDNYFLATPTLSKIPELLKFLWAEATLLKLLNVIQLSYSFIYCSFVSCPFFSSSIGILCYVLVLDCSYFQSISFIVSRLTISSSDSLILLLLLRCQGVLTLIICYFIWGLFAFICLTFDFNGRPPNFCNSSNYQSNLSCFAQLHLSKYFSIAFVLSQLQSV